MKLAGMMLGLIGAWGLVTLIVGGFYSAPPRSEHIAYAAAILTVAPWTGTAVLAIGCMVAGVWLYDKKRPSE